MTLLSGALKIQTGELVDTIHETADKFGAKNKWGPNPTDTGVTRMALTDFDKGVKDWFVQETKKLGCKVVVDDVGNIFATYPGKNNDALPTGMGSHLDTQPTGGRYDGILGVLSGLEVLRTLKANNYTPNFPITLVDWCNEEGARFPVCVMASSVWAGVLPKEKAYALTDVYDNETTVLHELNRIGYKGKAECSHLVNPLYCHFEIHIEQGPILEQKKLKIGVLKGVQAYTWLDVTLGGKSQHTGTTPLEYRRDAMLAASKVIVGVNAIAKKYGGVGTVAKIRLEPNVVNVIAGTVNFMVDLRNESDEKLALMSKEVKELVYDAALNKDGNGVALSAEVDLNLLTPATHFNPEMVDIIEASAKSIVGDNKTLRMVSGAGHDSCATNTVCPTAMIFVPSKDGVSHNPEEYTDPEELENGFRVLLESVLRYDQARLEH